MLKKIYKLLFALIGLNFLIVCVLSSNNIVINSWIGNAAGSFLFFLPVEVLLHIAGKDEKFSDGKRKCCKFLFWFIIVCYLAGGIATLIK